LDQQHHPIWISSIIPSIDRDLAELQDIGDRHQRERQAFFDRKNQDRATVTHKP
jgi:hypothetical protein